VFQPSSFTYQTTPQVTTKHGTEESKAAVDYAVYDAKQQMLRHENGVSEAEVGLSHKGGRGPWRICFRVSSGALLRPSVMVKMSYFSVHYEDYAGEFDWENENPDFHAKHLDAAALGSKEQIEDLEHGLLRLDHYLQNVTAEQRHLYGRTLRHLKTAESTLRRTFWYYLAIYCVICAASFSQLFVVRMMFKKVSEPSVGADVVMLVSYK
jgi:hypothetical protein